MSYESSKNWYPYDKRRSAFLLETKNKTKNLPFARWLSLFSILSRTSGVLKKNYQNIYVPVLAPIHRSFLFIGDQILSCSISIVFFLRDTVGYTGALLGSFVLPDLRKNRESTHDFPDSENQGNRRLEVLGRPQIEKNVLQDIEISSLESSLSREKYFAKLQHIPSPDSEEMNYFCKYLDPSGQIPDGSTTMQNLAKNPFSTIEPDMPFFAHCCRWNASESLNPYIAMGLLLYDHMPCTIINYRDSDSYTPLMNATINSCVGLVRELLKQGAELSLRVQGYCQSNALMLAYENAYELPYNGSYECQHRSLKPGSIEIIKMLQLKTLDMERNKDFPAIMSSAIADLIVKMNVATDPIGEVLFLVQQDCTSVDSKNERLKIIKNALLKDLVPLEIINTKYSSLNPASLLHGVCCEILKDRSLSYEVEKKILLQDIAILLIQKGADLRVEDSHYKALLDCLERVPCHLVAFKAVLESIAADFR